MAMLPNPMIAPRSILLEPVLADDGVQRLVQDCEPGQCLLFADHERRVDPDRGRVRHRDQAAPQALLVQRLGDGLREGLLRRPVTDELDAEHQPAAAHLADAPVLLLQRLEACEHDLADALGVGDEILLEDDLERGEPRGGGERVAPVARGASARVGPRLAGRDRVRGDHAGERESAAHALADRHDVRDHAVVLRGPHRAGSAEPRQHLVHDQQRAVLARDRLDRSDEPLGRHHVAGGALNGLDDDRADLAGGLVANDVAHKLGARDAAVRVAELERAAVAVGVRRQVSTRRERPQVMLELAPDETEHTTSLAVKPAPKADDLRLARGGLGQPQGCLDRLRTAGEHLDAREAGGRDGGEQLEELGPRLGGEAAERQPLDLPLQGLHVVRVAVADAPNRDPGDEVDVLVAVLVDEGRARAAGHREPGHEGEGLTPRRDVAPLLRHDVLRARTDFMPLGHCTGAREPGRLRGWPETRCEPALFLMARSIPSPSSGAVQEAERQVGGDALRRLVAVEREARPGVHVQQHGRARRRDDHVPAVHLEAERHRRAAHEAREAPLVERMAGQALVLVVEPAEPRRRVVRPAGADAVELHEVAVHVRLEDRAGDPARREPLERLVHGVGRGREDDVAVPGVVDVGAFHPHGPRPLDAPVPRGHDAALDERHVRLRERLEHPLTIGIQDRLRGVHVRHAARLERAELPEHLDALAHEEDEARPGVVHAVDVVRSLEDHLEPPRLEMLARQTQDLGVVRLSPRRMRDFPEDAPAGRALHACPPRKSYDTRPAKASASAIATSPARSTSTTVSTTSPKSGSPAWQSQPRNSRSRPSSAGATRVRTRSDTRYIPAVTRSPDAPPRPMMRPPASTSTRSGFSSATSGVTASTVASTGRRDAASTKRTKSASRHHASTVETSIRPPGRQAVTSRKLASDDRVVFTMNSRSRSAKRDLDQSATACSASLTMTTSDATPAARKFRITDSISGTPAMGTIGFGTVKPAWRSRLPSPAAMMPPRSGGALTGGAPRGPSASGSPGRLGSRDPGPGPSRWPARCGAP